MNIKQRIANLRDLFKNFSIDGYIVPSTDEYQNEYIPECAKRLEYITGFTGSNGITIILDKTILFFTDSRYLKQAEIELDSKDFEIHNISTLQNIVPKDLILGFDNMLFTENQLRFFNNSNLKPINGNLIDKIWENKHLKPASLAYLYPIEYAGLDAKSKIENIRQKLTSDYFIITAIDSICWLLNIRASDIEFSPLMLGYLVISKTNIWLFTNCDRITNDIKSSLSFVKFLEENELQDFLYNLKGTISADKSKTPIGLIKFCNREIINAEDPCLIPKAIKENIEINGFINCHIKDAIALCEAISFIEENTKNDIITEYEISEKLTLYRSQQKGYIEDSFPSIVGYQSNGAIIHYRPQKNSCKTIEGSGLLLIDSGAHYFGGTTDVTRTIVIGEPTLEQKIRYTQVLKGNIAIAKLKFPTGITGSNIDSLARMYLWQEAVDFGHSTGHGVGNALSVHEGPQSISSRSNIPLAKNMIISNEPGFYKNNEYGIRIEDLLYITNAENGFLKFKTLTLVPHCKKLIEMNLLTKDEINHLNNHQNIMKEHIYNSLSNKAKRWFNDNII